MSFVRKKVDITPIEDNVFAIVKKAKEAIIEYGEDKIIDASIGSLFNEEGKLVAFDSVFTPYNNIAKETKAAYAASFVGNDSFRNQVYDWVTSNTKIDLHHSVIATPGGTGAISITFNEILDEDESVVIPEIAWGSYALMASMHNLDVFKYSLFEEDHFNLASFKEACLNSMKVSKRLLVVINDPCHNPTGYTLTHQEWKDIITFLNECAKEKPVVLLNDIAYIDYSYDLDNTHKYMEFFNDMDENMLCVIAFSCSKTLTSYGLRCGAAIILSKQQKGVRDVEIVFEKAARAIWSNVPNAAMENFTYVTTVGKEAYLKEKQFYLDLMATRSQIFMDEAKENELPCYPYKEGFFVTIKVEDNQMRDIFHEALLNKLIFTVKVNKGIRVAICSLRVKNCQGLAKQMKEIWNQSLSQ